MSKHSETTAAPLSLPYRVSGLSNRKPTHFKLAPNAPQRLALAAELNVTAVSSLTFTGAIIPRGRSDFDLTGTLTATVEQPCVLTLQPVVTRLTETVERRYIAGLEWPQGEDVEMPEDVSEEPLGEVIDVGAVATEEMLLALPPYPRAPGAELAPAAAAPEGVAPLRDADLRPFAGLAALRDSLTGQSQPSAPSQTPASAKDDEG